mmetsp:Transcript_23682/g.72853  ORF Transcript_23682/g.72853 Transcript_23682/m.72853 type:complete len:252 (+) Transcript_23682:1074-1829(+)
MRQRLEPLDEAPVARLVRRRPLRRQPQRLRQRQKHARHHRLPRPQRVPQPLRPRRRRRRRRRVTLLAALLLLPVPGGSSNSLLHFDVLLNEPVIVVSDDVVIRLRRRRRRRQKSAAPPVVVGLLIEAEDENGLVQDFDERARRHEAAPGVRGAEEGAREEGQWVSLFGDAPRSLVALHDDGEQHVQQYEEGDEHVGPKEELGLQVVEVQAGVVVHARQRCQQGDGRDLEGGVVVVFAAEENGAEHGVATHD